MRRLGKHPARADLRAPAFALLTRPVAPASCNWYAELGDWPMLANDALGDCVPAAALHAIAQRRAYAGQPVAIADGDAVALYSRWGGYRPGDPSTDQGTLMADALALWHADGVPLADGTVDQLTAYARVSHVAPLWVRTAIWRCGSVLLGIRCPPQWLDPALYLFDLDAPAENAGGHCVLLVGYEETALGVEYDVITWGARCRLTERALRLVADEAYSILSRDWFDAAGHDPAGLDWAAAEDAMRELQAA